MTKNDDFDRLRAAFDQLKAEIKRQLTPILEAINDFAVWIGL